MVKKVINISKYQQKKKEAKKKIQPHICKHISGLDT